MNNFQDFNALDRLVKDYQERLNEMTRRNLTIQIPQPDLARAFSEVQMVVTQSYQSDFTERARRFFEETQRTAQELINQHTKSHFVGFDISMSMEGFRVGADLVRQFEMIRINADEYSSQISTLIEAGTMSAKDAGEVLPSRPEDIPLDKGYRESFIKLDLQTLLTILQILIEWYNKVDGDKKDEFNAQIYLGILHAHQAVIEKIADKPKAPETYYIAKDRSVSAHLSPSSKSEVVGTIYPEDVVMLTNRSQKWIEVAFRQNGTELTNRGWVLKKYLQMHQPILK